MRKPISLLPFLRSIGGIRPDDGGELANLGLRMVRQSRTNRRWLVHSDGRPIDRAREICAEAGYLWRFGDASTAIAETTPEARQRLQDFLEKRAKKVLRQADEDET